MVSKNNYNMAEEYTYNIQSPNTIYLSYISSLKPWVMVTYKLS